MTAGQGPKLWCSRVPAAGHPASTARTREAPTTQVAYCHPSASTAHTASAGAATERLTGGGEGLRFSDTSSSSVRRSAPRATPPLGVTEPLAYPAGPEPNPRATVHGRVQSG